MILKNAAGRAVFNPDKMGKVDLAVCDHLFTGLNAFEAEQEHEPHTHCDRDKVYENLSAARIFSCAATCYAMFLASHTILLCRL